MRHEVASVLFVLAAASTVAVPAYAQTTPSTEAAVVVVTEDQVTAACTASDATEASCEAIIAQYVAYLRSTGANQAALDAAMSNLVAALGEANVPAAVKEVVVAAIRNIADNYVSEEVKVALVEVADTIEAGNTDTGALGSSPA